MNDDEFNYYLQQVNKKVAEVKAVFKRLRFVNFLLHIIIALLLAFIIYLLKFRVC